jgi:hypothetical protein
MVRFSAQAYSYPKDPSAPAEWEDCAAYSVRTGRFAVADGASAAYRAREWAEQLTRAYITSFPKPAGHYPPPRPPGEQREAEVRNWFAEQVHRWNEATPEPTRWYTKDAAQDRPSSATFAGLYLISAPQSRRDHAFWEACAIGDSCVFHISGGQLRESFPMTAKSQFNKHPDLLTVAPGRLDGSLDRVQLTTGHAFPGDIFVLATDAASELLLGLHETDPRCLARIGFFGSNFRQMLDELRKNQAIEVDDVAMVIVAVHPDSPPKQ